MGVMDCIVISWAYNEEGYSMTYCVAMENIWFIFVFGKCYWFIFGLYLLVRIRIRIRSVLLFSSYLVVVVIYVNLMGNSQPFGSVK